MNVNFLPLLPPSNPAHLHVDAAGASHGQDGCVCCVAGRGGDEWEPRVAGREQGEDTLAMLALTASLLASLPSKDALSDRLSTLALYLYSLSNSCSKKKIELEYWHQKWLSVIKSLCIPSFFWLTWQYCVKSNFFSGLKPQDIIGKVQTSLAFFLNHCKLSTVWMSIIQWMDSFYGQNMCQLFSDLAIIIMWLQKDLQSQLYDCKNLVCISESDHTT